MNLPTENQPEKSDKEWQNPTNPEAPSDPREMEQLERQYEEAKRRKDNLSETDHIDKPQKKN